MKQINIIGGSGFIGTVLIRMLSSKGYTFRNLDKNPSRYYPHDTTIVDVRDEGTLMQQLPTGKVDDWVVMLAAEHTDNVDPISLYYDVNVTGMKNVLHAMDKAGITKIFFTSSVAVYGLNKENPDETYSTDPFNHYGKSKLEAEEVLREWYNKDPENKTLVIIRPTVVFGPNNRGNVYNLLNQIVKGRFLMIGKGDNIKSMSYVENVAGFISYCIQSGMKGYHLYNYSDKPDFSMNDLLKETGNAMGKKVSPIRIPYAVGYMGGLILDIAAKLLKKKFPISRIRIQKFCATTQFNSEKLLKTGYIPTHSLKEGLFETINNIKESEKTTSK